MPKRIQRKRAKGWRMPENTVYVGRPTKWGNPFTIEPTRPKSPYFDVYMDSEETGFKKIKVASGIYTKHRAIKVCVDKYRDYIEKKLTECDIIRLYGHDLACWCSLGSPCHADVLLDFIEEYIRG